MVKKALVLVGGICKKPYIEADVKGSDFNTSEYTLFLSPTEDIFDKSLISKMNDRFGDVIQYFKSHDQRKEACRVTRNLIRKLQADGYEVSVLAHSLGTIITLTCGSLNDENPVKVDQCWLFGSPLGFSKWVPGLGLYVRNHTRKYIQNFYANKINYIHSTRDFVSGSWRKPIKDILLLASRDVVVHAYDSSHDLIQYLNDFTS